jgi:hypothetical protein
VTPGDWDTVDKDESGGVVVDVFDHRSGLDASSAVLSVSPDGGQTWGAWQPVSCDARDGEDSFVTCCRLSSGMAGVDVRFKIADRAGNEGLSPAYGESARPTPGTTPGASPLPTASPTVTVTPDFPSSDLPDLVVDGIAVAPDTGLDAGPVAITVTIGNQAGVEIETGFWVELFVDPPMVPTINSIAMADGVGAFWYVPRLGAHELLSLSLEDVDGRYTNFGGSLPTGRHELYAYADAYNPEGEAGLVSEVDEANNLLGPVTVQIGDESDGDGSEPATQGAAQALRVFLERLEGLLAVLRRYVGSQRG